MSTVESMTIKVAASKSSCKLDIVRLDEKYFKRRGCSPGYLLFTCSST